MVVEVEMTVDLCAVCAEDGKLSAKGTLSLLSPVTYHKKCTSSFRQADLARF